MLASRGATELNSLGSPGGSPQIFLAADPFAHETLETAEYPIHMQLFHCTTVQCPVSSMEIVIVLRLPYLHPD